MPTINRPKITYAGRYEAPRYATSQSAGFDLRADLRSPLTLHPGQRAPIPTGIYCELPAGHELQVRPRSGLAMNHGVTVINSPGTVDPDYKDEVKVLLVNLGQHPYTVNPGERIAQAVLARFVTVPDLLPEFHIERAGGFGSTGNG